MLKLSHTLPIRRLIYAAIAIFSLMLTAGAFAASNDVTLIVGGKPAPFEVSPFVNDDGIVMAPADFVRLLGADYAVKGENMLTITSASGHTFTQTFEHVQDRLMVPLLSTAESLGASTDWSPATNTFTLKAKLELARIDNDSVVIATSYPVYYKTQTLSNPSRLVIDVYGTDLDSPAASIPSDNTEVSRIRTGQLDPQTVRLVLDLSRPLHFQVSSALQTDTIQLALNTKDTTQTPVPSVEVQPATETTPQVASDGNGTSTTTPTPSVSSLIPLPAISNAGGVPSTNTSPTTKIIDVEYQSEASNIYQVVITTAGPITAADEAYHAFFVNHATRIAFDLPDSEIDLAATAANAITSIVPSDNNPLLHDIRWGMTTDTTQPSGRVVVDLLKPAVYTVSTVNLPDNSGVQYTINIQQSAAPTFGDTIAGKTIIVDPGHGGKDTGAPGAGGIYEKNFTLAIAKQLRDALIAAGAHPIMTRSDDTFIPLNDRSQLGIDDHADYFISIHCDSSGAQNSHSGDTVYFHGNVTACRTLARSIANRLAQLEIAVQSDGIKSDYVRFPGVGFSVLRKSPEPAVLVECGYVNDDGDAKCLEDPASQQQIAQAIVAGLRDYIANQ